MERVRESEERDGRKKDREQGRQRWRIPCKESDVRCKLLGVWGLDIWISTPSYSGPGPRLTSCCPRLCRLSLRCLDNLALCLPVGHGQFGDDSLRMRAGSRGRFDVARWPNRVGRLWPGWRQVVGPSCVANQDRYTRGFPIKVVLDGSWNRQQQQPFMK